MDILLTHTYDMVLIKRVLQRFFKCVPSTYFCVEIRKIVLRTLLLSGAMNWPRWLSRTHVQLVVRRPRVQSLLGPATLFRGD